MISSFLKQMGIRIDLIAWYDYGILDLTVVNVDFFGLS